MLLLGLTPRGSYTQMFFPRCVAHDVAMSDPVPMVLLGLVWCR